jgi:hypothetical protein
MGEFLSSSRDGREERDFIAVVEHRVALHVFSVDRRRRHRRKSGKAWDFAGEHSPKVSHPGAFDDVSIFLVSPGRVPKGRKVKEMDAHREVLSYSLSVPSQLGRFQTHNY